MDERLFEPLTSGMLDNDRPRRIPAGSRDSVVRLSTWMPSIRREVIVIRFNRLAPVALAAAMAFVEAAVNSSNQGGAWVEVPNPSL